MMSLQAPPLMSPGSRLICVLFICLTAVSLTAQERQQAAFSVHLDEEKPFRAAEAGFEISRNDLLSGVRFQSNLELQNGTDFGMTDGLGEEPEQEHRVFAKANQKKDPWVVEFADLRIQRLDEIRVFSWNRDTRARQDYDLVLSSDGGSTWQPVVNGVTTKANGALTVTRLVAPFDAVTNLRFTFREVRNNTHSAILEIDALGEKIPDPTVESVLAALEEPLDFKKHVSPIFDRYCLQCHEGDDPNGDMDIGGLDPDVVHGADTLRWHAMLDALNRGEMPPSDMSQPKNEERLLLVGWLTQELEKAAEHKRGEIVSLPRSLTKTQYRNTLNDLLGLDLDFGAELPDEGVSAEGFQNNAEVLTVSALQTEYYMKIAREALGKAIMLDEVPEIQHFRVDFGENINPDINPNNERVVLGFRDEPQRPVDYRYQELRLEKPFDYHLHRRRTNYIFDEGWAGNGKAPGEKEFHDIFHSVMVDLRNGGGKFELLDSGFRLEPVNAYVAGKTTAPTLKVVIREFPREGNFAIRVRASLAPGAPKDLADEAMPLIHGYLGTRRDDAETFDLAGEPLRMTKRDGIQEFQFVDRLEKMPLPTWEPESRNFLSNLAHVGTFNVIPEELNQGQRVIVHSMAFEAPYFEEYPPKSHQRIFVSEEPREILERFLTRAWRRPPTDDELTLMLGFQKEIRETDHPDSFEASILETLVIALTSPQFLYIHEPVPDDEPRPLTDYELASRLSYFLWNTMPDDELLRLASRGELRGQLDSQIDRMLADERSWGFVRNFVDQWLDVSRMDRVVVQRRRNWTPEVAKDAKLETIHFFAELLRSNGSVLELIDSDWVMTNQNLAQFYRDLEDAEIEGDDFRRVSLPDNHRRGGVLTHASILTGHSSGVDSHPVKRGVWLTKRVLATPPPPAPPGVPPLDEEDPELQKLSIRKQLELHRDNAACSNCHQRIDPWGVAMEEFDTIGMYRRRDATAVLPNGDTIAGMEGLKVWLLENRKRDVTRSVVRHLTAWALGRSLSFADNSLIDEMVNEVEADEYRIQSAILAIVQNELFLNR